MSLVKMISTVGSVGASVMKTVLSAGKTTASFGKNILSSKLGKVGLGVGVGALLFNWAKDFTGNNTGAAKTASDATVSAAKTTDAGDFFSAMGESVKNAVSGGASLLSKFVNGISGAIKDTGLAKAVGLGSDAPTAAQEKSSAETSAKTTETSVKSTDVEAQQNDQPSY